MLKGKCRLIGFVLTLVLCLALSGASSAADQQGVANKVITIGISSVMSGGNTSQNNEGAKVYLDMVNRNGGVNGYTFKYIERDNANQPAQAVAVVQQMAREDKVFAVSMVGTPGIKAVVPIADSLKYPMFTMGDGDLLSPVKENLYSLNPRYSLLPLFEAQFIIKNLNIKELAYVYEDDAVGRPALKHLPGYVSANGAKLSATLGFAVDTTDWAPFATRLKESGAQAVIWFGLNQLAMLQKAADAIGYRPKWVAMFPVLQPVYLKLAGPLSEGVYIDSHVLPVEDPGPVATKYRAEMKAAGREAIIGLLTAQGLTAASLIVEGVRRATASGASLTWDSFNKAMNTINNQQVGMYPAVTYTPDDHTGATRAAVYQVQNGKFVQVLPMTDIPKAPSN